MPIQIKPVIWDVPQNIKAFSTTRIGGYSKGEFKDSNFYEIYWPEKVEIM